MAGELPIRRFPLKVILIDVSSQRTTHIYRIGDSLYLPERMLELTGLGKLMEKSDHYILETRLKDDIIISDINREVIYQGQSSHFSSSFIRHEENILFPIDLLSIIINNIYKYQYYLSLKDLTFYIGPMSDSILKLMVSFEENTANIDIYFSGEGQYLINKKNNGLEILFLNGNTGTFIWESELYPFISISSDPEDSKRFFVALTGEDPEFSFSHEYDGENNILSLELQSDLITLPPDGLIAKNSRQAPLRNIVIDAGHGGEDTGAVGYFNLKEKDIVLDVALALQTMIRRYLGINVVLTRDRDEFVSLDQRTDIANKANGDLFISIHANWSRYRQARGFEVFYASNYATDDDAYFLSQVENLALVDEADLHRRAAADIELVLWELAQSEFMHESMEFASIINDTAVRELEIVNRGVKQAPFFVLMGVNMPSVLVEIGFITNREEALAMKTSEFQEKMAGVIFEAIKEYRQRFNRRRGISEDQFFTIIPAY